MPTVLEQNGFRLAILLPPREHGPPHVHVYKAGGMVVINLPHATKPLELRSVTSNMRDADTVAAVRLVEANLELCLDFWHKYHG